MRRFSFATVILAILAISCSSTSTSQSRTALEDVNSISAYSFADANHGWLAHGMRILETSDGGKSWHDQFQVDSRAADIRFVSTRVGWIELQNGYLVTRDGGVTWQRTNSRPDDGKMLPPKTKPNPVNEPKFEFCTDDVPFAGPFAALNKQTAWAFCTSHPAAHYLGGVRLFQTKDGGKNWQLITDSPAYGPWGASGLFFVDQQHGWIGLSHSGISATGDGGRTWSDIVAVYEPRNIQFVTPSQGFVIDNKSSAGNAWDTLLRTDDGGATWDEIYRAQ